VEVSVGSRRAHLLIAVIAVALVGFAALAANADAFPNETTSCIGCHAQPGPAPVVTLVSKDAGSGTYAIAQAGQSWAVFDGATRVAGAEASSGQFTVALGSLLRVFAVTGYSTGEMDISPTGEVVTPAPVTHTLTYGAGEHGTISGANPQTVNDGSDGTTVTAVPDAGYRFVSWSDGVLTAARTDTKVKADLSVTAAFAPTKVATSTTLAASAKTIRRGGRVTLRVKLKGGAFASTYVSIEVKRPGSSTYKLLKKVKVSSSGSASHTYRLTKKGAYYHRARFLGSAAYLASKSSALKLVVK
jgi:hypothetical protein